MGRGLRLLPVGHGLAAWMLMVYLSIMVHTPRYLCAHEEIGVCMATSFAAGGTLSVFHLLGTFNIEEGMWSTSVLRFTMLSNYRGCSRA